MQLGYKMKERIRSTFNINTEIGNVYSRLTFKPHLYDSSHYTSDRSMVLSLICYLNNFSARVDGRHKVDAKVLGYTSKSNLAIAVDVEIINRFYRFTHRL